MTVPSAAGVVVPARNEAGLVGECLAAVRAAAGAVGPGVRIAAAVVADRCTDATESVAAAALAGADFPWVVVPATVGNPGAARRVGVDAVVQLLGEPDPAGTWIATTDADTRVPRAWLTRMLDLAAAGHDGVAGAITVDRWDEHPPSVRRHYQAMLRRRRLPGGSHSHVYGANLGVRLSALRTVGGMPTPPAGEDAELWSALRRYGLRLASPADLLVVTSGRRRGRATGGLADLLTALAG